MARHSRRDFVKSKPQKKKRTIHLPSWLGPKRFIALCAMAPLILPLLLMTAFWMNDQYRHGSLYEFCDQLPVSREYIPLQREVFMHGCYTRSVCPNDLYTVSMVLSRYEVISLKECLRPRVQRPDRAIRGFVRDLSKPEPKPQLPEYKPMKTQVEFAETNAAM